MVIHNYITSAVLIGPLFIKKRQYEKVNNKIYRPLFDIE